MTHTNIDEWTTKAGYPAIMKITLQGHINGYVGVPKEHPAYGINYYEWDTDPDDHEEWNQRSAEIQEEINKIQVHGGLSFAEEGDGKYLPKGYWWFGFDTAHVYDKPNFNYAWKKLKDVMTEKEKYNFHKFKEIEKEITYTLDDRVWRSPKYVRGECELLAEQLKVIEVKFR